MPCEHKCQACGEQLTTTNAVSSVRLALLVHVIATALLLILIAILYAPKAHGQIANVSDEIYVLSALNVSNGPSDFRTRLDIRNATGDAILVSFLFRPVNTFDSTTPIAHPFALWIGPHATMEIEDILGLMGIVGQGQLVLDSCFAGADCSHGVEAARELAGQPSMRRAIGVSSQNCQTVAGVGSHCWARSGLSFNEYISSDDTKAGLGYGSIVGIQVNARYLTRIGVANMTVWSSTLVVITLGDGDGNIRGQVIQRLGPFESWYPSAENIFPILTQLDCSDALHACKPLVKAPWIRVDQTDTIPLPGADAFGCVSGCPRFYAWADVADRVSHSVTPLSVTHDLPPMNVITRGNAEFGPPPRPCQILNDCGPASTSRANTQQVVAYPQRSHAAMYARSVIPAVADPNGPQTAAYANRLIDLTQNAYARLRRLGDQLGDPVVIMAAVEAALPVSAKAAVHRRLEKE